VASALAGQATADEDTKRSFTPVPGATAQISAAGQAVTVTTKTPRGVKRQHISFDTEHSLVLNVDDYNFDSHRDFAVSHIDDGMGTYTIYEIYVYSKREDKFVQLHPSCGESFVNIVLVKKRRQLINSYMTPNGWNTCVTTY
jgi:hypothetical protein